MRKRVRAEVLDSLRNLLKCIVAPPTEKNRPNLGNRRLNVPAVYIMPQLGDCQHAPSLPGRADTYPHPLISLMLRILETVMNTAPGCSLAAKRLLNRISPRKRRSLYEPLPSDGLSANRTVRWISGSRVNRYSQVINCSSTWTSRRTEHGVWPSGVFIFCASLASTRGG